MNMSVLSFLPVLALLISACGFDEIPKKETVIVENKSENSMGDKKVEDIDPESDGVILREVELSIAEKKTKVYFCSDYASNEECEIDWDGYQAEQLSYNNFGFKLALSFDDQDKLEDVACGFRGPDGVFYDGEFSVEYGVCFAFYEDYTGSIGRYDLYVESQSNLIPGNSILFMFDAEAVYVVDTETKQSFSYKYLSGETAYGRLN